VPDFEDEDGVRHLRVVVSVEMALLGPSRSLRYFDCACACDSVSVSAGQPDSNLNSEL
jgi:hypothetical protein